MHDYITHTTFEAGTIYGNWQRDIRCLCVKRTKCYVTFSNGLKRKIRAGKTCDGDTYEYVKDRFGNLLLSDHTFTKLH